MARHADTLPHSRDGAYESSTSKTSLPVRASFDSSRPVSKGYQDSRNVSAGSNGTHQNFVLTDPVAFRYLEEDSSTTVLDRRRELTGYECFIVEQWATSRTHPTFIITTYTGDPSDKVVVGVLSVPTDEDRWSQRLRVYFKALNQYHARRRDTPLGIMMVTNLSGFPSSLTVIPVPEGNLRKHRADFFVNENLKRLGCSGRVGLTFTYPNGATVAKFHQLYRTSDKNQLYSSVIELVKLCQAALHLFDMLDIDYVDGLLCDVTEKAINDWWISIGTDIYNIEPHDGILGPTTVAALLGLLMGARNRLHALSSPVPKDPFDIEDMKRGIADFQKGQKITKTRRLERKTLMRLQKASEKYANSEGWRVPRALKSTVAELSGKGGEMLADVVSRRDRAGVADIETTDMEHFEQLVFGERCKWLWQGKPLKHTNASQHGEAALEGHLAINKDDPSRFVWSARKTGAVPQSAKTEDSGNRASLDLPSRASIDDDGFRDITPKDDSGRHSMRKRATGLIDGGRSGYDRIKEAINPRRNHNRGDSRAASDDSQVPPPSTPLKRPPTQTSVTSLDVSPTSPVMKGEAFPTLEKITSQEPLDSEEPTFTQSMVQSPIESRQALVPEARHMDAPDRVEHQDDSTIKALPKKTSLKPPSEEDLAPKSPLDGPEYHGVDLADALLVPDEPEQTIPHLLRRTQSYNTYIHLISTPDTSSLVPRSLSFSVAADAILLDDSPYLHPSATPTTTLDGRLASEKAYTMHLQLLRESLASLSRTEGAWTNARIESLTSHIENADADVHFLETSLYQPSQAYGELKALAAAALRDEGDAIGEGRKELETLVAKLEYEISNLRGKVEDAEVGVRDFERAVKTVEQRVEEVEAEWERGSGWGCIVC